VELLPILFELDASVGRDKCLPYQNRYRRGVAGGIYRQRIDNLWNEVQIMPEKLFSFEN